LPGKTQAADCPNNPAMRFIAPLTPFGPDGRSKCRLGRLERILGHSVQFLGLAYSRPPLWGKTVNPFRTDAIVSLCPDGPRRQTATPSISPDWLPSCQLVLVLDRPFGYGLAPIGADQYGRRPPPDHRTKVSAYDPIHVLSKSDLLYAYDVELQQITSLLHSLQSVSCFCRINKRRYVCPISQNAHDVCRISPPFRPHIIANF